MLDVEKFVALQRKQNRIPPDAVLIGFRQGTRKWSGTYELEGAYLTLTGVMNKAERWLRESEEVPPGQARTPTNQAAHQ